MGSQKVESRKPLHPASQPACLEDLTRARRNHHIAALIEWIYLQA
jgi:hypothetical protein